MDLDTQTLKECRIGPIVLFYTKTKRVTPAINRSADSLVQAWSRPIIKRPASFRNRHVETQDNMGGEVVMDDAARKEWRKRFDTKAALKDNEGRKGARPYLSKASLADHIKHIMLTSTCRRYNTRSLPNHGFNIIRKICSTCRVSRPIIASSTSLRGR
jgi:hypothetical protein